MTSPVSADPVVQTMLFERSEIDVKQHRCAYFNPVQIVMAEEFPTSFNLAIVTSVYGASKGILSCSFVLEMDGTELLRHDHSPVAIASDGAGVSFNLSLQQIVIVQPGELVIKTWLSNGIKGAAVRLPVLAQTRVSSELTPQA